MKVSELLKLLRKTIVILLNTVMNTINGTAITGKDFRIPRHKSKEIPTGTLNRILIDAGLK